MMKVAIVILNWNGQQMLADYLGQVVEYSKDEAEIIVPSMDPPTIRWSG